MVRYSDELLDEIRNNNDIVDIISQYVTLKRSGRNYFGLCPFHKEKSPSFSVSPDKQIFHCFGCGVGGNVFHFISKIENINFVESVSLLAEKAGIPLPVSDNKEDNRKQQLKAKAYEINEIAAEFYHQNLYRPTSKNAQEYVKKRKMDNNTLKTFSLGFAGNYDELFRILKSKGYTEEEIIASSMVIKNDNGKFVDRFRKRFMIPIKDVRNRVIAFGGRVLDDSKPKYINSPESIVYSKGRNLFGLNVAKQSGSDKIIIVEGYMDAISLYQRGIKNVVASLGTALTEAQGRLLRKYCNQIIIGYDSDSAGQAATMRGLEILQNLGYDVRVLQLDEKDVKDPDEYILKYGSGRFSNCVDKAISLVEFKVKVLKNNLNIDTTSDKIKFLNQIANILSKVENNIEKEIYIEKISKDYNVSKEAIYAQINKLIYQDNKGQKILENRVSQTTPKKVNQDNNNYKRECMTIFLLLNGNYETYDKIKNEINSDIFTDDINKQVLLKIYSEYSNSNANINSILDNLESGQLADRIASIMSSNIEITDIDKATNDIINIYRKEKLINRKTEILEKLEEQLTKEEKASLEQELTEIITKLVKLK